MQMQVHHHTKDRTIAVEFMAPQRRILRAIPQVAQLAKQPEIAKAAPAEQSFSPLIQEFLDECGYSDK